ncbi:MAG: LysR substrate-binding domain-containing protein [Rhodocyclaceae bacterium]|nr:LysR substrate-binding domain-containing protein [Rhodocyclaceae bacterium]
MKNVTLRQLKVFEAVANHLSFSRAAEELHLTQPAVSMQVQALVEQAGVPLFEQLGKKVYLTAAGEELLRHARRIAQQLREAGEAMAAIRGVKGGRLNIGVVSTAKYIAPRLLVAFRARHPEAELRLGVENRETVVRQLAENEIDLAIMGVPPKDFETVAEVFSEHPHVIVAAPEHPLAATRRIKPEDLAGEPFLIREPGSGTRGAMERFFGECGIQLANTVELASNETIKQAVMAGMGISFISGHSIGLELAVGRIVKLDVVGTPVIRHWHIVHRSQKELLPMAAAFLDFVRAEAPRLIAEQPPGWCPVPALIAYPAKEKRKKPAPA